MTIKKSIHVKRPVETAFRVFTEEIGKWWPLKEGYSFGGDRADQIFLEGRTGGRFFERFTDGEEYVVGVVTTYSPPSRIVFEWKQPDWDAPTEVEVRFTPEGAGTLVEPSRVRPDVHIYTRSKVPWLTLPESVPAFEVYYDSKQLWPAASLERLRAAFAAPIS